MTAQQEGDDPDELGQKSRHRDLCAKDWTINPGRDAGTDKEVPRGSRRRKDQRRLVEQGVCELLHRLKRSCGKPSGAGHLFDSQHILEGGLINDQYA